METVGLIISCLGTLILILYLLSIKRGTQLQKVFLINSSLVFCWCCLLLAQKFFCARYNINPILFEKFIYICSCFLPVSMLFTGIIFANTKITFKKRYILLFIIPITSIIMIWTNDYHHLFYKVYSTNINETIFGDYFYVHNIYTLILYFLGLFYLVKYSIKNSGIFSKQAILFSIAAICPITVNALATIQIITISIYVTPICFTFTVLLCAISIFKFQFLEVAPIALQKIVDRISDSYVVVGEKNNIVDFNNTFIRTFNLKEDNLRSKDFIDFLRESNRDIRTIEKFESAINETKNSDKTISFEREFREIEKFFMVEITPISSKGNSLGTLILFKDVTQHKQDMETIKNNQDILMERERLASLGQLIGGIAHNLKTPIMSVAGAAQGLEDLIKEYDMSIESPVVTPQDHHEIAKDMEEWIVKIRNHIEYMSDIITTVKGQAVALSNENEMSFSVMELVKRVDILMKHELKNAFINFNVQMKTDENLILAGDVNSLVQVINNMISNSIQAYCGKHDQNIELIVSKSENNVIFSVKDYAGGLPREVQDKLFKEMITTKGKNGTGLGLYMSYSNIKAHFSGNITFETSDGVGTTFNVILPLRDMAKA